MSTFDNPFDPNRRLHAGGCSCGRHVSEAEHQAAQRCRSESATESEEKRYEGVVASAVMRAMFPQDVARRAFLKSVGAATARGGVSQFFPLKTATEVFAQGGPLEKKDLKVGFIPITCATPIIMAAPMGFYSKNGLNVEVIKTAGWAVIRDKTINKEYDAAHMLSPMPLAITMGAGSNPIPYTMPAIENINGQAITLVDEAQGQARSEGAGRASSSPFRSTIRCTITCCATISPSTASTPISTCRSARCRRRKWSPICAPTISTASSGPIR